MIGMDDRVDAAHAHSFKNRAEIIGSSVCGCYFCLAIFAPSDIREWLKAIDGKESAFCPRCAIDAVIGSASGFPITREFLQKMQERWFQENTGLPEKFFERIIGTASN